MRPRHAGASSLPTALAGFCGALVADFLGAIDMRLRDPSAGARLGGDASPPDRRLREYRAKAAGRAQASPPDRRLREGQAAALAHAVPSPPDRRLRESTGGATATGSSSPPDRRLRDAGRRRRRAPNSSPPDRRPRDSSSRPKPSGSASPPDRCTGARFRDSALRWSRRRSELRGGFGFKLRLRGPDLIGRSVPVPFAQPVGVVEGGELGQGQPELLDGREMPDPEELLLHRPDRALGHAVAFRLSHEGGRAGDALGS